MSKLFVVVDKKEDWGAYYPSDDVISVEEYLNEDPSPELPAQVINLCRDYKYLGHGYYCSLLAEARGDKVIPSVRTINELSKRQMYALGLASLDKLLQKNRPLLEKDETNRYVLHSYFGTTAIEELQGLARQLFDMFPSPILEGSFKRVGETWAVESVKTLSIHQLEGKQEDEFAAALSAFNRKVWRKSRTPKRFAYNLAMLVNPDEQFPPSNRKALENFMSAGKQVGIDVEVIGKKDYTRLTEYDALFIRETTAVNDHTYRFAQKAEFSCMPVIDAPDSILKCANKVYLSELMRENEVPTPATAILYRDNPESLINAADQLGFPIVLKIPDGSFSRGVHKVSTMEGLKEQAKQLFQSSVLVLAQEFMYTDFDWRIGVLGGRPLFACKYFMSKGHWQIYNHAARGSRRSGGFATMAVEQAPHEAVKLAVKACGLIGKGLYGVDIKQGGNRFAVIEVNDNPNIDAGVEDLHLGKLCYLRVMGHFFSEMERYRYGAK
ncbi:MAG: RimK family protein [Kiritimatiellales bacterium]|nr:RimK family protein [Kiritimatiellales bacterium]